MKIIAQDRKVIVMHDNQILDERELPDDYSILSFSFFYEDYKVSVLFYGGFCELEFYQTDDGFIAINGGWIVSQASKFDIMSECMRVRFQKYDENHRNLSKNVI